ncbi:hypothetical protein D3C81_1854490 [compost metagenome]
MTVANRLRVKIPATAATAAASKEMLIPDEVSAGLPSSSAVMIAAMIAEGIKLSHCCRIGARRKRESSRIGTVRIRAVTTAQATIASKILRSISDHLYRRGAARGLPASQRPMRRQ